MMSNAVSGHHRRRVIFTSMFYNFISTVRKGARVVELAALEML
jgi:hypothetical protein